MSTIAISHNKVTIKIFSIMQLFKELLNNLSGYDALVYSAMKNSLHPNDQNLYVSNDYLMGRIHEMFDESLTESLKRLEEAKFIRVTKIFGQRRIQLLTDLNEETKCLKILLEYDRLQSPVDKVYLSYLFDRLEKESIVEFETTLHILNYNFESIEEFINWFSGFKPYGLVISDEGTIFTELELPISDQTQQSLSSRYSESIFGLNPTE